MITYFHFGNGSNPYMAVNDKAIFFMVCHYDLDMVAARSFEVLGYRTKYLDRAGKKEALRDFAKHYQSRSCMFESSWLNECEWGSFFENYGKRYGLLREFRENGIC